MFFFGGVSGWFGSWVVLGYEYYVQIYTQNINIHNILHTYENDVDDISVTCAGGAAATQESNLWNDKGSGNEIYPQNTATDVCVCICSYMNEWTRFFGIWHTSDLWWTMTNTAQLDFLTHI